MFNYNELLFCSKEPYPEISVTEKNCIYANWMLDNLGGANSEISAISLYVYDNLVTEACYKDISMIFHRISIVEMHHLEIFGKLSCLLGEDPRLWTSKRNGKTYWSPGYNTYSCNLDELVQNALARELHVIEKYENQICAVNDPCIIANLKRIILDEEIHVALFRELIKEYHL